MKNVPVIRPALEFDAAEIADLIYSTSVASCFTPEQPCPEWYRASLHPDQIAKLIKAENMDWIVAVQENKIAGVLAVGDNSNVKYFFVHPAYQKLGIGKQLWNSALCNSVLGKSLTVRSSLNAVPVYERLGFKAVEAPEEFNGLHYQTMVSNHG